MRFALTDVKKRIHRRDGEAYLTPHLLRPKELAREIAALIALYESFVGRPRADFPDDDIAALIGDYRVARGLQLCASEHYEWQSPAWPASVGAHGVRPSQSLAAAGISTPSQLRLALYDHVNQNFGGFLTEVNRDDALIAFSAALGLTRDAFDELLYLDADERAVLHRLRDAPPTPAALATRYNQLAVEALLFNSASVEWTIAPPAAESRAEGLGTIVKRVCFLARRMGVSYDVAFAPLDDGELPAAPALRVAERHAPYLAPLASAPTPPDPPHTSLDGYGRAVTLTLYGPQELTGAPQQYGERLARLCRALLGYRRHADATGERSAAALSRSEERKRSAAALSRSEERKRSAAALSCSEERGAAFSGVALQGAARVYLHGRPLIFPLDERLLKLLGPDANDAPDIGAEPTDLTFDSSLEGGLYREFTALERAGEAHGWWLEREPEPVIANDILYVPDFALTRGATRVYLEIAGYWRPEYRERKVQKLLALRNAIRLLVAVPESAREAFAPLDGVFPLIWYTTRVSAQPVLRELDRAYDDSAVRLAAVDARAVLATIAARGRIAPHDAMDLLACFSRAELAPALEHLAAAATTHGQPSPLWLDEVGLCSADWHAALTQRITALIASAPHNRLTLTVLHAELRQGEPTAGDLTESAVESLARSAGLHIIRDSIFEAVVSSTGATPSASVPSPPHRTVSQGPRAQPREPSRRKSRDIPYATQPLLPEA
ncbi:MAG: hypothetical protein OJF49_003811 [Ktedonobacterales bacterium]|jgi:predicted nuclease of restriction endonuclease-like RecB superfamily|nr:MAG: hypothetical protein OJF49_003811 [Ktedonobacterales bacterium]